MTSSWIGPERRSPTRPQHGDRKPCPDCGGPMFFHEGPGLQRANGTFEPGWSCARSGCGWREFVRRRLLTALDVPYLVRPVII